MRGSIKTERLLIMISVFLVILSSVSAFNPLNQNKFGQIKLLAVQEVGNDYKGSVADLYLEIKPGDGRVFIDTFPLSKIDTQISTRFAKEIVCNYLDKDCSKYDFFYTIRSESVIVGGPSASAAIAGLTFATLEGLEINDSVTITGTINSGGLIGPVSGLKEKVDAASVEGIETVLVASGNSFFIQDNNTIDLIDYGEDRSVVVKEVSTLEDLIGYLTGVKYEAEVDFIIPDEYLNTMEIVSTDLCDRTKLLHQQMIDLFELGFNEGDEKRAQDLMDIAVNLSSRAESSLDFFNYYSAASYCFGANIRYQNIVLLQKNYSNTSMAELIQNVENNINKYEVQLDNRTFNTLTDLETYIIVKERLLTSKDFLENAKSSFYTNKYDSLYNLAYAMERFDSTRVWEKFFDIQGKQFKLNEDVIEQSCIKKLSEAQERYQYVKLFLPVGLEDARRNIERAMQDYKNEEYDLCVSKASNAKATVNVLLGVMGVPSENIKDIVIKKLDSVRATIAREQSKGVFPILGYSYYEYANSLKDTDMFSALIYAEQALEMTTLDIYFEEDKSLSRFFRFSVNTNGVQIITFALGIAVGVLAILLALPTSAKYRRFVRRKKIRKHL
jgi:uncharacterized protein